MSMGWRGEISNFLFSFLALACVDKGRAKCDIHHTFLVGKLCFVSVCWLLMLVQLTILSIESVCACRETLSRYLRPSPMQLLWFQSFVWETQMTFPSAPCSNQKPHICIRLIKMPIWSSLKWPLISQWNCICYIWSHLKVGMDWWGPFPCLRGVVGNEGESRETRCLVWLYEYYHMSLFRLLNLLLLMGLCETETRCNRLIVMTSKS